ESKDVFLKEVVLGRKLSAYFAKKYGVHKNPENTRYLQSIGNKLSENTNTKDIIFYFGILNTGKKLLYSLPGGYILISKGMIKEIENEAELTILISTAIAHINLNHSLKVKSKSINYFGTIFPFRVKKDYFLDNSFQIKKLISKIDRGFPKSQKKEAEEAAILLSSSIGYEVINSIKIFKNIYPDKYWKVRNIELKKFMKNQGVSEGGKENREDFQLFKNSLLEEKNN
ncbi:MAG: hypothetical protein KDK36_09070, partial [Leptospiraceae bacterium]|nr:hypothetical protein [Leptospiraceae bacterium]